MPHAPESRTNSELELHRVEYFRSVADYAEMVRRGGDLTAVCEGAHYVQSPVLALIVPTVSSSVGTLSSADVADLPRSMITRQVANGVAVRMAVLFLMLGSAGGRGA